MSSAAGASQHHRIKHAVVATGDADLFPVLSNPVSTRKTWMSRGVADRSATYSSCITSMRDARMTVP